MIPRFTDIFALDHLGQTLSLHKASDNFFANGERPWLIDADGDGQDELLFINHHQVSLLSIDNLEQPIWVRRKAMTWKRSSVSCQMITKKRLDASWFKVD